MDKNIEIEIRNYLKTLTETDILNSIHLTGNDFENDDIEKIMESIYNLYVDVDNTYNYLKNLNNEEKHSLTYIRQFEKEDVISKNLNLKYQTLSKVLSNEYIVDELRKIIDNKNNRKKPASK